LNEYGIKFCKPIKYDYIVFQKTEFTLTELEYNDITDLDYSLDVIFKHGDDFKRTINSFVNDVKRIEDMTTKIKISWQGEKKTILNIKNNIYESISNPTFVLAVYDILFKFTIATICYYTIAFLNENNFNNINQIFLNKSDFPETFKEFIDEYNTTLTNYIIQISSNNSSTPTLEKLSTKLIARLHVLDTFVEIPNLNDSRTKRYTNLENIQYITNLLTNINRVLNDFKNLYNYV